MIFYTLTAAVPERVDGESASSASIYFGGSYAVDLNWDIMVEFPLHEKAVADVETGLNSLREIRENRPLLQNELFEVYKKHILQDY